MPSGPPSGPRATWPRSTPAAAAEGAVARAALRLDRCGDLLPLLHPRRHVLEAGRRLAAVDWRSPAARGVERARSRLGAVEWAAPVADRLASAAERVAADRRHLAALSPQRVLERGYAVVTAPDGRVLRRSRDVVAGQRIGVRLGAGGLQARVEEVDNGVSRPGPGPTTPP